MKKIITSNNTRKDTRIRKIDITGYNFKTVWRVEVEMCEELKK